MIDRQTVPEDLAEWPPGPALGAILAGIDRSRLNGHDAVTVLQARARQVAHEQAQFLADLVEVAHCPAGDVDAPVARVAEVDEFAADEIRMALRLTRRAAESALHLALDVVQRLPRVHTALLAGEIDLPRARTLSDETAGLDQDTARRVIAQVIDAAPGLTTGQVAARARALAISIDPDAARKRQAQSVQHRRLVSQADPDGTATLAGYQLPLDRAALAAARVDSLARAAKRSGDLRNIDQLRADTFLDLLAGLGPAGLDPIGRRHPSGSVSTGAEPTRAEPTRAEPTRAEPTGRHLTDSASAAAGGPSGPDPAAASRPSGADPAAGRQSGKLAAPAGRGGVELSVSLTTLMGLTDTPGELAGWGPVLAETARQIAARNHGAAWRVSVYDHTGRLVHNGAVRRRPTTGDAQFVKARDRTCRAPGCRTPAGRADLDHTRRHADGGPTTPDNLAVLCRHDHRLKDEGGWRLRQLHPGVFVWRSRLGHQYAVAPDPTPPP